MLDQEIIGLFWQRDEQAIAETNAKYGKYCRRVAANILGSREDAEECVNDTWLKTWNAIPENRPKYFQGFLAKITRNLALDRWKRQTARKRGRGAAALALEELEECVSGFSNVELEYEARELYRAIDSFINALPEKEQYVFVQRYFYMEAVQAIAESLQVRDNHVSVILSRTRKKLRRYLQEEGYEV